MRDPAAVLIAAISGRALAQSARRAGFAPLVLDCFGDDDTRGAAAAWACCEDGLERGFQAAGLMSALARLAGAQPIAGVVCGAGFEDRPELLDLIEARWRLLGNRRPAVARAKDPLGLAHLCGALAIPHPEVSLARPARPQGWLRRRRGGCGGGHIMDAATAAGAAADAGFYYQRRVAGQPVSALLVAAGYRAVLLGLSAQWTAPAPNQPFRYGGAVRPPHLADSVAQALGAAAEQVARALALVGLNSIDFLVGETGFWLIEVNPRPGATLDLFEPGGPGGSSLFGLHVAACAGQVGEAPPADARAAAIVYADRPIARLPALDWPDWARDRQPAQSFVAAGAPLCTVVARAAGAGEARRLVAERAAAILAAAAGRAA